MSDYNEAFPCQRENRPEYNSGHNIPGYPQYLSPYVIKLIQEYDHYEKSGIIPGIPMHRRLTYKEFLTVQRYYNERSRTNRMTMGEWIKDPFA